MPLPRMLLIWALVLAAASGTVAALAAGKLLALLAPVALTLSLALRTPR